jgi:hypothetical protein
LEHERKRPLARGVARPRQLHARCVGPEDLHHSGH